MILIVKVLQTTKEFEKVTTKFSILAGNTTSAIGRFFTLEQIEYATKEGLFKELKAEIAKIEDTGKEVYYLCTESTCENKKGKRLFFASNAGEEIVLKLLTYLISMSEGQKTIPLEEWEPMAKLEFGSRISGEASSCPLF